MTTMKNTTSKFDIVGKIIDYESGGLSDRGILDFFAHLIKSGMAWKLQGHYGRTATALINRELISNLGEINEDAVDELLNN